MMMGHAPHILWDWGTAYDLFASLDVLHHPEHFGLRGSWAAGVRSRLTSSQRTILEDAQKLFFSSPLGWVSNLPQPKDADTALWSLSQIPPAERLPTLAYHAEEEPEILELLKGVLTRRAWDESDLEQLQLHHHIEKGRVNREVLVNSLNWWSQIPAFVKNEGVSRDISRALEVEAGPRKPFSRQPEQVSIQ